MDADVPNPEPSLADFASVRAFIKAYDAYHDGRRPTAADTLDRAVRLASDSMRGIDLQCRRVRSPEPEDDEWISRVCMDFQFLIVCLWRMRMAGRAASEAADEVRSALAAFDREVPDLALMRHVSQHLEDYALDGRKRRQKAPASAELVGRRALEVMSWNENRFIWLGGTIDIAQAREAAARLYSAIRQVRDSGPT